MGKKDPVTRAIEIAVHWIGFDIDVTFWSQHISFYLVGCIVLTSIRGLLLTLTKVCLKQIFFALFRKHLEVWKYLLNTDYSVISVFLRDIKQQIIEYYRTYTCSNNGKIILFDMDKSLLLFWWYNYMFFVGYVFCVICASNANEYACGISDYNNSSFRRIAI